MKKPKISEEEVVGNYVAIGKAFKKAGFEEGWNACLDDFQEQLRNIKQGDKIIFQYFGVVGDKSEQE